MSRLKISHQHDSMQCGIACLQMVCRYFGREYSFEALSRLCFATTEGVSMLGISQAAQQLGLQTTSGRITVEQLCQTSMPCILHWNENHFVVLYKISKNRTFYIWQYRQCFGQIILGLLLGCLMQLAIPFLTQAIVDVGIKHHDIHFIWLILVGELMIVTAKTATDFIRRWLLIHISMRINISLVSDFFIKLLRLPMAFITLAIVILFIAVLCVPYPYCHGITIFKQIFGL